MFILMTQFRIPVKERERKNENESEREKKRRGQKVLPKPLYVKTIMWE